MTAPLATISHTIVDDFIEATIRCLHDAVGVEAVRAATRHADRPDVALSVAIDLKGSFAGPVTWQFPTEIALELVRRLVGDPEPAPESAYDGAAELANILTGSATGIFESAGFRCELGIPRPHDGALPAGLSVELSSPNGPIHLVLSLRRSAA